LYIVSRRARADFFKVLDQSRDRFGAAGAERLRERLYRKFDAIGRGVVKGHLRRDVNVSGSEGRTRPLRFATVDPFVIAFRPGEPAIILRIVHGARDIGRVFGRRG